MNVFILISIGLFTIAFLLSLYVLEDTKEYSKVKVQSYEEFWHTEYVCRGEHDAK